MSAGCWEHVVVSACPLRQMRRGLALVLLFGLLSLLGGMPGLAQYPGFKTNINGTDVWVTIDPEKQTVTYQNSCGIQTIARHSGASPWRVVPCPRPHGSAPPSVATPEKSFIPDRAPSAPSVSGTCQAGWKQCGTGCIRMYDNCCYFGHGRYCPSASGCCGDGCCPRGSQCVGMPGNERCVTE